MFSPSLISREFNSSSSARLGTFPTPDGFFSPLRNELQSPYCQESRSNISNSCAACRAKLSPSKSHKTKLLMAAKAAVKTGAGIGRTDGIWHHRLINAGGPARIFKVTLRLSLTRLNVRETLTANWDIWCFDMRLQNPDRVGESEVDQDRGCLLQLFQTLLWFGLIIRTKPKF